MRRIILVFVCIAMAGCATSRGFNRTELHGELNKNLAISDEEISKILDKKPQLPKPFRLAVYFREPIAKSSFSGPRLHWSDTDKQKILNLAQDLKENKEASEVFPISEDLMNGNSLHSIRAAAARAGADAVLIVSGVKDVDRYTTDWAATYFLLLPMLFVPASAMDVLFISRAAMWDVRNEFLYMSAEAESLQQERSPAAFTHERELTETAKSESIKQLRLELMKMVAGLKPKKML